MDHILRVRFWGVRGSLPTPGRETANYGGNTTCIEVVDPEGISHILDAGSGIRRLGDKLSEGRHSTTHVYISHSHLDHIQGFPFFKPAYMPNFQTFIYSGKPPALEEIFNGSSMVSNHSDKVNNTKSIFNGPQADDKRYFPVTLKEMPGQVWFKDLSNGQEVHNGLVVSGIYHTAHGTDSYAWKLKLNNSHSGKRIVYTGDYQRKDKGENYSVNDLAIARWAEGADLFITDGHWTLEEHEKRRDFGHSDIYGACELAALSGAKRLAITHHAPEHHDSKLREMEFDAKEYARDKLKSKMDVFFAREGLEVEI